MLKVGNIVQIICQKYTEYLAFGEIMEIKDNNMVVVKIPKIFPTEERIVQCHIDDLELQADYPPEIKAGIIFGKYNWHTIHYLTMPMNPERDQCMYANCQHQASRRGFINIWGSVCEADLCAEHADQYHNKLCDIFPWKKKTAV